MKKKDAKQMLNKMIGQSISPLINGENDKKKPNMKERREVMKK